MGEPLQDQRRGDRGAVGGEVSDERYALLSGGKDSICAASKLCEAGRLAGCVFIETGIAAPDTRPFVEKLCRDQGWPLHVFAAKRTYEDAVEHYGFPKDLAGHSWAFGILKERAMRAARDELGRLTVFASGARRRESARRSRSVARGFRHNGRIVIENPIVEMTTPQVWAYLHERNLPVSPAYLSLGRSGDCLCGAFSQRGEADVIRRAYPDVAERLRRLERHVRDRFPWPQNRWGGSRTVGGFTALQGRRTLESFICGGDCADREEQ